MWEVIVKMISQPDFVVKQRMSFTISDADLTAFIFNFREQTNLPKDCKLMFELWSIEDKE